MMYIALIGDIIESKKIQDRAQVQQHLLQLMKELNQQYQNYLVSPFTVTTGDEFQALLLPNKHIFQIIDEISLSFLPYEIRFGIGRGDILTKINKKQSIESDGPAYWKAREAINTVHAKNYYGYKKVGVCLEDKDLEDNINSLLLSSDFIKAKWTDLQYDILKVLLDDNIYIENFSNNIVANRLNISPSAFNKRLKASGLKIYLNNRVKANELLIKSI